MDFVDMHMKYEKLSIPIWVLNLERSYGRRQFMEQQLQSLGLAYEIVKAVDALCLSESQLSLYSKKEALRCKQRELGRGEIGCFLSHVTMWQRVVDEGINEVLILEDDVYVGAMLIDILKNRDGFPGDTDVVNFRSDLPLIPFGEPICDIYRFGRFSEYPNRACAYLLTQTGAKKLLEHVYPIRWPLDDYMGRVYLTGLVIYGIDPQVVGLKGGESDIWLQDNYYLLRRSLRAYLAVLRRKLMHLCLSFVPRQR